MLGVIGSGRKPLVVVEVVFRLRRELGEQTLGDLSKVAGRLLIGRAKGFLAQNNIPNRHSARILVYLRLIVA